MKISIKIINQTPQSLFVALHPSLSFVKNKTEQFGAYAASSVSSGGSIYASLSDSFLLAGVYKNPDKSTSVTAKEDYTENTIYLLETEHKLSVQSNSGKGILIQNNCGERAQYLISNPSSGIWLDTLIPGSKKNLPKAQELLSNLSISFYTQKELPDFFSTSNCTLQELNSTPQSVWQCRYATWEIHENEGTGKISLSGPDYTPFSPLDIK